MTEKNTRNRQSAIGPVGAVATVPGEFVSSAIFEVVQGAYSFGGAVGRAVARMRRS